MIRVVVVGDIRLYREGVALRFVDNPRCALVGTAASRESALGLVRETQPHVVVVDMTMVDSLATVRDVVRVSPDARVVALTVPEVERAVMACAEAGISGYVTREASLDDLVPMVDSVVRGETMMSPKMVASLLRRVSTLAADRSAEAVRADLTIREAEIVDLLRDGLSNKQIASRLGIELATVKNHVHNILDKLHVHRRADAVSLLARSVRPSLFSLDTGTAADEAM